MHIIDNGLNNKIIGSPHEESSFKVVFYGSNSTLEIGNNVVFNKCNIYIHDSAEIVIGSESRISGSLLAHNKCSIIIGEKCRCNSYLNISTAENTKVSIGVDCLVAQATIRTSDMHPIYSLDNGERINPLKIYLSATMFG